MPKSKQRGTTKSKRNKRLLRDAWLRQDHELILKQGGIAALRDAPDFRAVLKFGRLMNSLGVCGRTYEALQSDGAVGQNRRDAFRILIMWIGFLHEGFLLIETMRKEYKDLGCFKRLDELRFPEAEAVFREVRNRLSFHMDRHDISVKHALNEIDDRDRVVHVTSKNWRDWHFVLADDLDFAFLSSLIEGPSSREETLEFLEGICHDISREFMNGFDEFYGGIVQRLGIRDYIATKPLTKFPGK